MLPLDCCYLVAQSYLTLLRPHGLWPARLLCPWNFPGHLGKNKTKQNTTGVDRHFLFQGILPTQGLKGVSCIAGGSFSNTELPGKPFLMLRPQLFCGRSITDIGVMYGISYLGSHDVYLSCDWC